MRFLVVDDDQFTLEVLQKDLAGQGYKDVSTFSSATQAIEHLDQVHDASSAICIYDCLLLDIRMPEMDGVELCREIRKRSFAASVPIVMITSLSGKENVIRALSAGATDFMKKPIDTVELMSRISSAKSIVREQRHVLDQYLRFMKMSSEINEPGAAFSLPFKASNAKNYLDFQSVENFLLAFSGDDIAEMACIAFRPDDGLLSTVWKQDERFLEVIRRVARKFSRNLSGESSLFTYVGHGIFLAFFKKSDFAEVVRTIRFVEHRFQSENAYPELTLTAGNLQELVSDEYSPFEVIANAVAHLMLGVAGGADIGHSPLRDATENPKGGAKFAWRRNVFQGLRTMLGMPREVSNPATLADIRERFIVRLSSDIEQLSSDARNIRDGTSSEEALHRLGSHAHRTAGVAATLGLGELGDKAARLDLAVSRNDSLQDVGELPEDFDAITVEYLEECKRICREISSKARPAKVRRSSTS